MIFITLQTYLKQIRHQENVAGFEKFVTLDLMNSDELVAENKLASVAKKCRQDKGITKAQAARDMGVKEPSIFHAEESPDKPYTKLRLRMIEAYSEIEVVGPVFVLRQKK